MPRRERTPGRRPPRREPRLRALIVCAAEQTESAYFKGLRDWLAARSIDVKVVEYWLLLHHDDSASPSPRCAAVADRLRRFVPSYDKVKLRFDDFSAGVEVAVARAKRRDPTGKDHSINPSSGVWTLVDALLAHRREETRDG